MTKHCRNHRIRWQKKIDFSYLDPPPPLFHFLALGLSLLRNQAKWKRLPRRLSYYQSQCSSSITTVGDSGVLLTSEIYWDQRQKLSDTCKFCSLFYFFLSRSKKCLPAFSGQIVWNSTIVRFVISFDRHIRAFFFFLKAKSGQSDSPYLTDHR